MEKIYLITLGTAVFILHISGVVAPKWNRELGRQFMAKHSNVRGIGFVILAFGICALLVSNLKDLSGQLLFVFGVVETLGGLFLSVYPAKGVARFKPMFAKSIKIWVLRGIVKCLCALGFIYWGLYLT